MGLGARMAILAMLALVALSVCSSALATFPGQNGKIAFSRDGDIWIMDPDGSNQEQITTGAATDLRPKWAPDGSAVAFWRHTETHDRIYVYDLKTGLRSRFGTFEQVSDPAWSPNGRRLVFGQLKPNRVNRLAVARFGSLTLKVLPEARFGRTPDWSPGGSLIAWVLAFDTATIYTVRSDGTDRFGLSEPATAITDQNIDPSWSPDGSLVAYSFNPGDTGAQIYTVSYDGVDRATITPVVAGTFDHAPAWSPDGTRIVFDRYLSPGPFNRSLYLMDSNGDNVQLLTPGQDAEWQPLVPPRNLAQPHVGGTFRAGETLTATPGDWWGTPEVSYIYQWRHCFTTCTDIAGATDAEYELTSDDVDQSVRVFVTATNAAGSATTWSLLSPEVGDTFIGTAGGDSLVGSSGSDLMRGLGGNDLLRGDAGDDIVTGGAGDDRLEGDAGGDRVFGGAGADRVLGSLPPNFGFEDDGGDLLSGGRGPDRIDARDGHRDTVDCGGGQDVVLADAKDDVHADCEVVKIG